MEKTILAKYTIEELEKMRQRYEDIESFKKWDVKYINDLPDSAFLYIAPGGRKDEEGKTVPRTLRKLPYKNHKGNIDLPHLRDAIARLGQSKTDIPESVKKKLLVKARKILEEEKKKQNMSTNKKIKKISSFSDEAITKLKAIVEQIEKAETLEEVKKLIPELKGLIPEETQEEVVEEQKEEQEQKQEQEEKTEEEKPEEQPKEEVATDEEQKQEEEQPEKQENPEQLSAVSLYELNKKMLETLEEMQAQMEVKDQLIEKLKKDLIEKDKIISQFKKEEEEKKLKKFEAFKNEVMEEYIKVLGIEDRSSVEKIFSAFKSEDALRELKKQLDIKKENIEIMKKQDVEPKPMTVASSVLREAPENVMTYEKYSSLPKEKKLEYLYEQYCKLKKQNN